MEIQVFEAWLWSLALSTFFLNQPLGLRQLVALNSELLALSRAGMPLDRGLVSAGRSMRGRLYAITKTLEARIKQGESLEQAVDSVQSSLPKVYRSVLKAGLRSGRLTSALEQFCELTTTFAESRRSLATALLYPIVVLVLGYGLLVVVALVAAPRITDTLDAFRLPRSALVNWLAWLGTAGRIWLVAPAVGFALVFLSWIQTSRSSAIDSRSNLASLGLAKLLGLRGVLERMRRATFADVLALLLEHDVAFDEAATIAGEASGDKKISSACLVLAEKTRNGESPAEALGARPEFPSLLRWLASTSGTGDRLIGVLRDFAKIERLAAVERADWIRTVLPSLLIVVIGAFSALAYASTLFIPLSAMLTEIGCALTYPFMIRRQIQ